MDRAAEVTVYLSYAYMLSAIFFRQRIGKDITVLYGTRMLISLT